MSNIQADKDSQFYSGVNALLGIKDTIEGKSNWLYYHTQQYTYRYVSNTTPVYGVYSHFFDYAAKGTSLVQGQIIILYSTQLENLLKKKVTLNKKNYSPYLGNDIKLIVYNKEAKIEEKKNTNTLHFNDVLFPGYTRSAAISGEPLTLIIDFIARKTDEYEDIKGYKKLDTFISEVSIDIKEPDGIHLYNLTSVIYPYSYSFSGVNIDFEAFTFEADKYKFPDGCPLWDEKDAELYFLNNNVNHYKDTSKITNPNFDPTNSTIDSLEGQDSRFVKWEDMINNTGGIEKYKESYLKLLKTTEITNNPVSLYHWAFDMKKNEQSIGDNILLGNLGKNPTPSDFNSCVIDGDTIKYLDTNGEEQSIRMLFYNTFESKQDSMEYEMSKKQQAYLQILLSRYLAIDPYCTDIKLKLHISNVEPKDNFGRALGIIVLTKTFNIPIYTDNITNFNSLFHYGINIESIENNKPIEFETITLNFILNMDLLLLTTDQRLALQIVKDYPQIFYGRRFPEKIEELFIPLGMWKLQQLKNISELEPNVKVASGNIEAGKLEIWKPFTIDLLSYKNIKATKTLTFPEIINELKNNDINFDFTNTNTNFTNTSISTLYTNYFSSTASPFILNMENSYNDIFDKLNEEVGEYEGSILLIGNGIRVLMKLTAKGQGKLYLLGSQKTKSQKAFIRFITSDIPSHCFVLPNYNYSIPKNAEDYKTLSKYLNKNDKIKLTYTNNNYEYKYMTSLTIIDNKKYPASLNYIKSTAYLPIYFHSEPRKYTEFNLKIFDENILFYAEMDLSEFLKVKKLNFPNKVFSSYILWDKNDKVVESTISTENIAVIASQAATNIESFNKYTQIKAPPLEGEQYLIFKSNKTIEDFKTNPLKITFYNYRNKLEEEILYKNETTKSLYFKKQNGNLYFADYEFITFQKDHDNNKYFIVNNNLINKILETLEIKIGFPENTNSVIITGLNRIIYSKQYKVFIDNINIEDKKTNSNLKLVIQNTKSFKKEITTGFFNFFDDIQRISTSNSNDITLKRHIDTMIDNLSKYLRKHNYYMFFKELKKFYIKFKRENQKENSSTYLSLCTSIINKYVKDNKYLECFLDKSKLFIVKLKDKDALLTLIDSNSLNEWKWKLRNLDISETTESIQSFLSSIESSLGDIDKEDIKNLQIGFRDFAESFCKKLDKYTEKPIKLINKRTGLAKDKMKYFIANSIIGVSK